MTMHASSHEAARRPTLTSDHKLITNTSEQHVRAPADIFTAGTDHAESSAKQQRSTSIAEYQDEELKRQTENDCFSEPDRRASEFVMINRMSYLHLKTCNSLYGEIR